MKDIEIKNITAIEIANPKKQTMYYVAAWYNGILLGSSPFINKEGAIQCANQYEQSTKHVFIYKFDIDVPNFNNPT